MAEAPSVPEVSYQAMMEHVPDLVWVNRNERIVYINPAGVSLLRAASAADILGRSPYDFTHPDYHQQVRERIARAMQQPMVSPVTENCLVALDGFEIPVEIIASSYRSGEHMDIQVTARDIRARREAEQRELKLWQQLQQAQRMEAIGQLTGGVAHDFNNLLTVILGNAELLCEQLGPDTALGAVAGQMSAAAQRGAKLTNALLAFARRQALDPVPLDVNELLQSMYQLLQRTLRESIHIELQLAPGLPAAMVDPAQLESAVLNLCLNARDAMPEGGVLTIETGRCELDEVYTDSELGMQPGDYLLVAVSDTGCGIPREHMPKLFEPFFTTKGVGKGTGLGLPMVYGFLKQSGGQVTVYSEPGEGTTVKLYLPLANAAQQVRQLEPVVAVLPRGSEKILLVEDDSMVREYARTLVESWGYTVTTATNGPEALALLEQGGYDLLFTDIVMSGGMNGRQLADQAVALFPALKVLYTSGYTENAIVHNGRLDPGAHLISKPYLPAELGARLRAVLDSP